MTNMLFPKICNISFKGSTAINRIHISGWNSQQWQWIRERKGASELGLNTSCKSITNLISSYPSCHENTIILPAVTREKSKWCKCEVQCNNVWIEKSLLRGKHPNKIIIIPPPKKVLRSVRQLWEPLVTKVWLQWRHRELALLVREYQIGWLWQTNSLSHY